MDEFKNLNPQVTFIYPTNRAGISRDVKNGKTPDNALYGENHLEEKYDVNFIDVSQKWENFLDLFFTPINKLFIKQIGIDFKIARILLQIKKLNKADVIIANIDGICLALCFLKRLGFIKPPIIYAVGLFYIGGKVQEALQDNRKNSFASFVAWVIDGADQILYHSEAEKEKLKKLGIYDPAKCAFVAMGSDEDFFKDFHYRPDESSNLILSVGKDSARDYRTLFEAAKLLPDFRFTVICEKDNVRGLEVPGNVQIVFEKTYLEVAQYYKKAVALVIPIIEIQRSSGQMTLTDAMQLGLPVIVSDVAGIRHYPIKNNLNVLIVPPQDVKKLARAIRLVGQNSNLRKRIGANLGIIAKDFTTKIYAKKLGKIIKLVACDYKIRAVTESDLEFLRGVRNDNRQFFFTNAAISKADQKKWYKSYKNKQNDLMFILSQGNKRIGTGAIYNIDYKDKTAEIGRFAIRPDLQGKGYGNILLSKIEFIAFYRLGLNSLKLEVFKTNERAIKLYKKSGFKIAGKKNGNIILMVKTLESES